MIGNTNILREDYILKEDYILTIFFAQTTASYYFKIAINFVSH